MAEDPLALECHNLGKRFGGLEAVSRIELQITAGERRAIIGPNGAGKTTLFRLISGEFPVTSGTIHLFQHDVTRMPCHKRTYLGLGRTFQITNLFPTLTVLDNLVIAAMGQRGMKFSLLRPLSTYHDLYRRAEEILESVGMIERRHTLIRNLSHGEQRQIEISLALISKPRVLLLDEPTAGLSPAESAMMTGILKNLDSTMTILIIEHDMDVAFQVAERITVFHQGCLFTEGTPAEVRNNPRVQEIYFGAEEKPC